MADNKTSSPPRTSAPDLEILGDQVTLHPSGYIEPPERPHDGEKERNLVEHMARFRSSPLEFLREVSLHVSGVSTFTDGHKSTIANIQHSSRQDGVPTIISSDNLYSIPDSRKI